MILLDNDGWSICGRWPQFCKPTKFNFSILLIFLISFFPRIRSFSPHNVLNVNDQMKVMIIDLDSERGRISLSTKALEPEPGDMLTDPQKVFSKAEEMAAKYKQMLFEQTDDNDEIPTASAETV